MSPGISDFMFDEPTVIKLKWWVRFLLLFKKTYYDFEPITKHTKNVTVYKYLFGKKIIIELSGVSSFELPPMIIINPDES